MSAKIRKLDENGKLAWFDKRTGKKVKAPSNKFALGGLSSTVAYVIDDTMPLIKSPLSRTLHFDSKRALRAHYKQHGVEEVGNEYERGYDPGAELAKEREKKLDAKIRQDLIDRLYHGKR